MTRETNPTLRIGKVVLTVHDLDRVSAFYQQVIGLHRLTADGSAVRLGTGQTVLLELRRDRSARRHSPQDAGLFHTAFLLPTRPDLGRWVKDAMAQRLTIQGASDHLVSEAIYLADPEGNGIEIYADRPRSTWEWNHGQVHMTTERLDVEDLARSAGETRWSGFPEGGTIGHVHLQVGDIGQAERFYADLLGFDITCRYPGGTFYSTSGYHHHLATNVWNSRGAPVRAQPSTGLAEVEILARGTGPLDALRARAAAAGVAIEEQPSGLRLHDPWKTSLTLVEPTG